MTREGICEGNDAANSNGRVDRSFQGGELEMAGPRTRAYTLKGESVNITVDGNTVLINDARVIIADIPAANGTIHLIDSVLIPAGL